MCLYTVKWFRWVHIKSLYEDYEDRFCGRCLAEKLGRSFGAKLDNDNYTPCVKTLRKVLRKVLRNNQKRLLLHKDSRLRLFFVFFFRRCYKETWTEQRNAKRREIFEVIFE